MFLTPPDHPGRVAADFADMTPYPVHPPLIPSLFPYPLNPLGPAGPLTLLSYHSQPPYPPPYPWATPTRALTLSCLCETLPGYPALLMTSPPLKSPKSFSFLMTSPMNMGRKYYPNSHTKLPGQVRVPVQSYPDKAR